MDVAAARRVAWPSEPRVWPELAALTLVRLYGYTAAEVIGRPITLIWQS